jgi:hypothetical protein
MDERLENFYRCYNCEIEWQNVDDCESPSECPKCEANWSPYMSREYHEPQYICLCLQDTDPYEDPKNDYTYVQSTRRRFTKEEAEKRIACYAPSRKAVIVQVPYVSIDEDGYPNEKR